MKTESPGVVSWVSWDGQSQFCQWVFDETARTSKRLKLTGEPHGAMLEVWTCLKRKFPEGQRLSESDVRIMRIIITRRILDYLKSRGVRRPKQPHLSLFDYSDIENVKSPDDPPDQLAANRELLRMIESELSQMPPYRAGAVRSRFGYPDAPEWSEFVQASGTTRQNATKHAMRGLEELKLVFA